MEKNKGGENLKVAIAVSVQEQARRQAKKRKAERKQAEQKQSGKLIGWIKKAVKK
jgi:hypothetical protein